MKYFSRLMFLFVVMLACSYYSKAQHIHQKTFYQKSTATPKSTNNAIHICGTEASVSDINYLNSIRNNSYEEAFTRDYNQGFRNSTTMYVPIKAHIVRTTAGTGGLTSAQLNAAITVMNSFYINANMQFYLCGGINYIDNDTYYNFNQSDETALTSVHDVSTNINIYFMNSVTSSGGSGLCGYAYFPGGPNHIIMDNGCAQNGSTLSHEVGHFYALYHTHGKSNTGTTDELVDGSNCSNHGDDVCDTPADPNLSGLVTSSCVYTGTATDANGDTYVPDPNNIMSYSRKACRTLFSPGQYARINSTAVNSSFRNNYSCPSSADDAGISEILKPLDGLSFCDNPLTPEVVLSNNSASALTSTTINYQIDNGPLTSYNWTGNLGPGASDTVTLASFVPPINPVFVFRAYTTNPNGNTDNDFSNDTLTSTTQYLVGASLPYEDSLNDGSLPTSLTSFNQSGDAAEWVYNASVNAYSASSAGSVSMDNFNNDTRNTLDWLFVQTLDLSSGTNMQLSFDVAYARYNASFTDTLIIAVNDNCGSNYSIVYLKGGSDLATAADQTTLFTPSATQWRTDTVDLSAYDGQPHVRVAFINQGGYGQPIYLDNLNVKPGVICNLSSSASSNNVSCNGGNDGSITITASGSSSYSYDIGNGPQASNSFNNLSSGNYNITVSDGLGCQSVEVVSVGQPANPLSSNSSATIPVSCFGGNDGSFTMSSSGGTPNYSYNIGSGNQSSGAFTGLTAATYTVTVTDANSCTVSETVTVNQPSAALTASLSSSSNINCAGGNDGVLNIAAAGGTATYTYNIGSGPQGNGTFNNLTAGNYTVTVSDVNGCTTTISSTLTQPSSALNASTGSISNLTCNGDNSGTVTVSASGGTASYTYNIGNGNQAGNQFTGLAANSYTITVTDNNGCSATTAATVTQPAALSASTGSVVNISCFGDNNGSFAVNASGGVASYTYNIGNGNQAGNQFTGLTANNYTVTVTDNNSCTATTTATINQPAVLNATSNSVVDVTCFGENNGSFAVNITGGTATYSYNIGSGNQASNQFTGLAANSYTVTVTDNNNCTTTTTASINQPATALNSTITIQQNVNCNGATDGTLTLSSTGGTAGYTYDIGNGPQSTSTFNNLSAGNYTVTVSDNNNCTVTVAATLTEPTALTLNLTDNGNNSATATVAGGVAPYTYLWDASANNQTTATASGLTAGTHCVTITDDNNCNTDQCVTIVISGHVDVSQPQVFEVLPNPTKGTIFINIEHLNSGVSSLKIINVLGQPIIEKIFEQQQIQLSLDLSQQANGVYFVQFENKGQKSIQKIIVAK